MIIYGLIRSNSIYTKEFGKLESWFIKYYPDIETNQILKIFEFYNNYTGKPTQSAPVNMYA